MSNINPRERFRTTGNFKKAWADTVDSALFHEAAIAAYADYKGCFAETTDPVIAAANYQRVEGARGFLEKLMSLSDDIAPAAERTGTKLNYRT